MDERRAQMLEPSYPPTKCKSIACDHSQSTTNSHNVFFSIAAPAIINSMSHCIERNQKNRPEHNTNLMRINTTSPFARTSMVTRVRRPVKVIWKRPAVIYNFPTTCQPIRAITHRTAPHRIDQTISPHRSNQVFR